MSVNPTTFRFGICVCSLSVSGMIVFSCGSVGTGIVPRPAWLNVTSCAPWSVGSTTGKLIWTGVSWIANAAVKLYAWKLDLSNTMPLSRISCADRARAVTCVTSSFSMTSIVTLSGAPRIRIWPPLSSRISSSV